MTQLAPIWISRPTAALRDVIAERERQKTVEGWTEEHDDEHNLREMAVAASCYAEHAAKSEIDRRHPGRRGRVPARWLWDMAWWKPTTPRQDLVKAGALILAEIERLDRLETKG